ncbi:MAG: hypothetical protein WCW52_09400 [Elusimicrobiales bacterium]|jgi:hypothetical protein
MFYGAEGTDDIAFRIIQKNFPIAAFLVMFGGAVMVCSAFISTYDPGGPAWSPSYAQPAGDDLLTMLIETCEELVRRCGAERPAIK